MTKLEYMSVEIQKWIICAICLVLICLLVGCQPQRQLSSGISSPSASSTTPAHNISISFVINDNPTNYPSKVLSRKALPDESMTPVIVNPAVASSSETKVVTMPQSITPTTSPTVERSAAAATICSICGRENCTISHKQCEICGKHDCKKKHLKCQICGEYDCKIKHEKCAVCGKWDCTDPEH